MKRIFSFVLAIAMIFSMSAFTINAAPVETDYNDAASHLAALNILKGDGKGNMMLDQNVTRYQAALFFVQALTGKTEVEIWNADKNSTIFSDVTEYGTAIDYAYGVKLILGRGNGVYGPNDYITYQDMLVMAVRALGYETTDMTYPYGYILAAQKLGLTDDIDIVNYKTDLNRGATAQIMWKMLNTEVAVVDPLTDKILYPGETGLTDTIINSGKEEDNIISVDRKTLLEVSGLAGGKIETTIVGFIEADENDEEDFDKVELDNGLILAAVDLDITAETHKVTYMGLSVEIFVSVDKKDFTQEAYDDGDAEVIFASYPEYTTVVNLGAEGNIKYTVSTTGKEYLTLGSDKIELVEDETTVNVYTFGADGWKAADIDLTEIYAYDSKDGYTAEDGNTYGAAKYLVTEDEEGNVTVDIYYTPFYFGQYIERELPSSQTGKDETYVVVGEYEAGYENIDGEVTDFAEYLLGGYAVNGNKVSKSKGEASMTVEVVGEAVQSGDFMFYAYNALDNVLTIAKNCGTFKTGRMTASSSTKETVKINGTNMEFGFAGVYAAYAEYDATAIKTIIDALEAGKDNVKYIAVDGNIVYMTITEEDTASTSCAYAIISTDAELMADLLGLTATKYAAKVNADGLYIEDGYVVVAALNLTTGAWELVKVETVVTDYKEGEFTTEIDIVTLAKYKDITNLSAANEEAYAKAVAVINSTFVAVVEETDGVYIIADVDTADEEGNLLVDRYTKGTGLTFNTVGRTNAIKATADEEVKAARVTTNDNTVIVVVDANGIQVRTGVQTARKNVVDVDSNDITATYWAAGAGLIVLSTAADVADNWGKGAAIAGDDTYYVVMPEFGVEYGTTDVEDEYTLTIEGLYDLKEFTAADALVIIGTYDEIDEIADLIAEGVVLSMIDDELAATDDSIADALEAIYAEDEYSVKTLTHFTDAETVGITDIVSVDDAQAKINATVVTFDFTGFDWADIDVDNLVVDAKYDGEAVEANGWDTVAVEVESENDVIELYSYVLDLDEDVVEINEPVTGVVGDFELAMNGKTIIAYDEATKKDVYFTVTYEAVVAYDVETETVNMYIVKVLAVDAE